MARALPQFAGVLVRLGAIVHSLTLLKHSTWCTWLERNATQTKAPSDSTVRQFFLTVDAQSWVDAFDLWAMSHAPEYLGFFSVDGKSSKCTSSGHAQVDHDFARLGSVYSLTAGVLRLALMFNQNTSEIGVAKRLLTTVATAPELAATVPLGLSLDTLQTQVETLELIAQQGCRYLVGLKPNQPQLDRLAQQRKQQAPALSVASAVDCTHGSPPDGLRVCSARLSATALAKLLDCLHCLGQTRRSTTGNPLRGRIATSSRRLCTHSPGRAHFYEHDCSQTRHSNRAGCDALPC